MIFPHNFTAHGDDNETQLQIMFAVKEGKKKRRERIKLCNFFAWTESEKKKRMRDGKKNYAKNNIVSTFWKAVGYVRAFTQTISIFLKLRANEDSLQSNGDMNEWWPNEEEGKKIARKSTSTHTLWSDSDSVRVWGRVNARR